MPAHKDHFIKVFAGVVLLALFLTLVRASSSTSSDSTNDKSSSSEFGDFSFAGLVVMGLMGFGAFLAVKHSQPVKAAIQPAFITAPKHSIFWRPEFQQDPSKFEKYLDPTRKKTRKLRYHEPGAQSIGMASMIMPKNIKLSGDSFTKHGLDRFSHAKQSELARRANEEAERLERLQQQRQRQQPNYIVIERQQQQQQEQPILPPRHKPNPTPFYASLNKIDTGSPVLIWFGLGIVWLTSIQIFSENMSDMEITAVRMAGTALLSLLTFLFTTEANVDLPVSVAFTFLGGILLYALSDAFVSEKRKSRIRPL